MTSKLSEKQNLFLILETHLKNFTAHRLRNTAQYIVYRQQLSHKTKNSSLKYVTNLFTSSSVAISCQEFTNDNTIHRSKCMRKEQEACLLYPLILKIALLMELLKL